MSECDVLNPIAGLLQTRPQLRRVEDLAVEYDPQRAAVVSHRLVTPRQIDDAQSIHGESNRLMCVAEDSGIVGTAMSERLVESRHQLGGPVAREAYDATHVTKVFGLCTT